MDLDKLYQDFCNHINSLSDEELIQSAAKAEEMVSGCSDNECEESKMPNYKLGITCPNCFKDVVWPGKFTYIGNDEDDAATIWLDFFIDFDVTCQNCGMRIQTHDIPSMCTLSSH